MFVVFMLEGFIKICIIQQENFLNQILVEGIFQNKRSDRFSNSERNKSRDCGITNHFLSLNFQLYEPLIVPETFSPVYVV